jgi:hypothetical protein
MKSKLKLYAKLIATSSMIFLFAINSFAIQEKPKKLTREEKREIKKAQAKAALKNTKRAEKAKASSK